MDASFDLADAGGPGAEGVCDFGEGVSGGGAGGAEVARVGDGVWVGDQPVDLACDVALEAADGLALALALASSALGVGAGVRVAGETDHGDAPEGVVGLAIAALVEPVAG